MNIFSNSQTFLKSQTCVFEFVNILFEILEISQLNHTLIIFLTIVSYFSTTHVLVCFFLFSFPTCLLGSVGLVFVGSASTQAIKTTVWKDGRTSYGLRGPMDTFKTSIASAAVIWRYRAGASIERSRRRFTPLALARRRSGPA